MSVVSNLFRSHDPHPPTPVYYRPAERTETHQGLRQALGAGGKLASDSDVLDFLRLAVQRRIDVNRLWVAERSGRAITAALPVLSPGRTMLLLLPTAPREPEIVQRLVAAICDHYHREGIVLAQGLVEPDDATLARGLRSCAFQPMAELIYLQRQVPTALGQFELPAAMRAVPYSAAVHDDFAAAVLASYEGSLDCPALNGMRTIDDILRGHRATGDFDPALWTLLIDHDRPVGVSLLNRLPYADACELVYFGLVPEARGRGLGHIAFQHTLAKLARTDLARLTLAVDAGNAPALHLYSRHGLTRVGRKLAMIRALNATTQP